MNIFTLSFPISYMMLVLGIIVGSGIACIFIGSISVLFSLILIGLGVIRIIPILHFINSILNYIFPGVGSKMAEHIRKSFPLRGASAPGPAIYLFHPHGMFSLAHFFHIGTRLTDWSIRPIQGTAIHWLWWIPFGKELLESLDFVSTDYLPMKTVLEEGKALSVSLGGVREIMFNEAGVMKLNIGSKRGIFRMALETGVPLVPVLVYGENELYEVPKSFLWLSKYGLIWPFPTLASCMNWFSLVHGPLENPVVSVIGKPIAPGSGPATEEEVDDLRKRYIESLRALYKKTRPANYAEELIIV